MLNKFVIMINNLYKKILFHIKLARMDFFWDMHCSKVSYPLPPSFYYTHKEEEIEQMYEDLRAYVEKLARENAEREETSAKEEESK